MKPGEYRALLSDMNKPSDKLIFLIDLLDTKEFDHNGTLLLFLLPLLRFMCSYILAFFWS